MLTAGQSRVAVPLYSTGFGDASVALVRRFLGTDALIAFYARLNQALDATVPNDESAESFPDTVRKRAAQRSNTLRNHGAGRTSSPRHSKKQLIQLIFVGFMYVL